MKQTESFHTTENMERISRQHLCDNLDSILETVSRESIGFVITDAGKDDFVLCPASFHRWQARDSVALSTVLFVIPLDGTPICRMLLFNSSSNT